MSQADGDHRLMPLEPRWEELLQKLCRLALESGARVTDAEVNWRYWKNPSDHRFFLATSCGIVVVTQGTGPLKVTFNK